MLSARVAARAVASAVALLSATSPTPALDARVLWAHAVAGAGTGTGAPTVAPLARYFTLVARRAQHEPVAYIVGERWFWSHAFACRQPVLIPRPDSEVLVDTALAAAARMLRTPADAAAPDGGRCLTIWDAGCGTGCLGLATWAELVERRHARDDAGAGGALPRLVLSDRSRAAVALARRNAASVSAQVAEKQRVSLDVLRGAIDVQRADWLRTAARMRASVDVVLSNPPYIAEAERDGLPASVRDFEDAGALFAGADGLDSFRRLGAACAEALRDAGVLVVEFGVGQGSGAVAALRDGARAANPRASLELRGTFSDLAGIERAAELVCMRHGVA